MHLLWARYSYTYIYIMQDYYEGIFRYLKQLDPPHRLCGEILARIEAKSRQTAKTRFIALGVISLASVIAMIPAFNYLWQEFFASGFYQYLSVLFLDGNTIFSYWKELALSLAESLPILGLVLFLFTVFVFLGSLKLAVKNTKTIFVID